MQTRTEIGYNSKIEGDVVHTRLDCGHKLVPQEFPLAHADGAGLLRHRIDGGRGQPVRHRPLRGGGDAVFAPAIGCDDCRRHGDLQNGAVRQAHL